jgi:hypothetical protein
MKREVRQVPRGADPSHMFPEPVGYSGAPLHGDRVCRVWPSRSYTQPVASPSGLTNELTHGFPTQQTELKYHAKDKGISAAEHCVDTKIAESNPHRGMSICPPSTYI